MWGEAMPIAGLLDRRAGSYFKGEVLRQVSRRKVATSLQAGNASSP
ncbi:hypothetical protein RSSM_05335 [Rhodopirellula sallentina SM41]|uniref:Uncharacterized protein n=1 Tax=Rhodopirellula sallentina SM41 TaxID=1263870 RepID=M5U5V8_9BACT|nr:hypothetical protein RSSM_05335 [Rhodopirellula sallentina SM41]